MICNQMFFLDLQSELFTNLKPRNSFNIRSYENATFSMVYGERKLFHGIINIPNDAQHTRINTLFRYDSCKNRLHKLRHQHKIRTLYMDASYSTSAASTSWRGMTDCTIRGHDV